MCRQQKQPAFQCACGTEILAEGGFAHTHIVGDGDGQDQNKDDEYDIFEIQKSFFQVQLWRRDFVDQLLQQAERAQPPADGSPEQNAEGEKQSCYIKAESKLHGTVYCLQSADGTGKTGGRAGIAV